MKLWLIRHAKSDWSSGVRRDFLRPLNARGERDGERMQEWLATRDDPATWIMTSDALRARATVRFVAAGFAAVQPTVIEDHRLYLATPEALLDVIRETPPDQTSLAVVAHNPGLTQLVNGLAGRPGLDNLPTFGIARFDVPEPWAALDFGRGTLEWLTSPKRLAREGG